MGMQPLKLTDKDFASDQDFGGDDSDLV